MRSDAFQAAVHAADPAAMEAALSPTVTFRSPAVHEPYVGREAVMTVLGAVFRVFEDFRYDSRFEGPDGEVLLFSARVGDRELQGIDLLHFDSDGSVDELTVMIRPFSGLSAVLEAVGRQLAAKG